LRNVHTTSTVCVHIAKHVPRMPATKKYNDFIVSDAYSKAAKHLPTSETEMREYVRITCPHCNVAFQETLASSLYTTKAGHCLAHLRVCAKAKDGGIQAPAIKKRGSSNAKQSVQQGPLPTPTLQEDAVAIDRDRRSNAPPRRLNASPIAMSLPEEPPEDPCAEMPSWYTVYGMRYRPRNVLVYVGSTKDQTRRFCAHANLTSGCRRVAIALCQKDVQPFDGFFCLEELWTGTCTPPQARAIESHARLAAPDEWRDARH